MLNIQRKSVQFYEHFQILSHAGICVFHLNQFNKRFLVQTYEFSIFCDFFLFPREKKTSSNIEKIYFILSTLQVKSQKTNIYQQIFTHPHVTISLSFCCIRETRKGSDSKPGSWRFQL